MEEDVSEIIVGALTAVMFVIGLCMAAWAMDDEIYFFGLSLAVFSATFGFGLIKQRFDRAEAKTDV